MSSSHEILSLSYSSRAYLILSVISENKNREAENQDFKVRKNKEKKGRLSLLRTHIVHKVY